MQYNVEAREISPGLFEARLRDGKIGWKIQSRQPLLDAARLLANHGARPGDVVQIVTNGGTPSVRSTVGAAARLTVEERTDGLRPPRLARWRPGPQGRGS